MNNVTSLQIPAHLSEFEDILRNLKKVHTLCNENNLPHNYVKILDNFTESWNNLSEKYSISTSPKLHIINDHLIDYFDLTEMTLRKTSDELIENMHQFMHKRLSKGYWVKNTENPSHGSKLLRAVKHINCYNLRIN